LTTELISTHYAGLGFADLNPQTLVVIRIGHENDTSSSGFAYSNFPTSVDWTDATNGTCVDLDECAFSSPLLLYELSFVLTRRRPP
jgi:hypothetical protein